jgi:hypothetical protein
VWSLGKEVECSESLESVARSGKGEAVPDKRIDITAHEHESFQGEFRQKAVQGGEALTDTFAGWVEDHAQVRRGAQWIRFPEKSAHIFPDETNPFLGSLPGFRGSQIDTNNAFEAPLEGAAQVTVSSVEIEE